MSQADNETRAANTDSETNGSMKNDAIVLSPALCPCSGNGQMQIRHLGRVLGTLIIRALILSLALAYLMALIDGLRTFGTSPLSIAVHLTWTIPAASGFCRVHVPACDWLR